MSKSEGKLRGSEECVQQGQNGVYIRLICLSDGCTGFLAPMKQQVYRLTKRKRKFQGVGKIEQHLVHVSVVKLN